MPNLNSSDKKNRMSNDRSTEKSSKNGNSPPQLIMNSGSARNL